MFFESFLNKIRVNFVGEWDLSSLFDLIRLLDDERFDALVVSQIQERDLRLLLKVHQLLDTGRQEVNMAFKQVAFVLPLFAVDDLSVELVHRNLKRLGHLRNRAAL